MSTKIEKITPGMAETYLGTMKHNRTLNERLVDCYAAEMAAGQWILTGESIKFNVRGELIDGQHRLHAILRSGITVEIDVRRNVPINAVMNIDTGSRRSPGHMLQIAGFNYTSNLASTIRQACSLLEIDAGVLSPPSLGKKKISSAVLLEWAEEHQDRLIEAIRATTGADAKVICSPPSLFAALYFLFAQHNPTGTKEFFEALVKGIGFETDEHDPVYVLRKSLLALKASRGKRSLHYSAAIVIKAWNAYQNRESIAHLRYLDAETWPEINRHQARVAPGLTKPNRRRQNLKQAQQARENRAFQG